MRFSMIAVILATLTSTALSAPSRSSSHPTPLFKSPKAQAFLVKTSQLPLFNGIPVQDSYAGRLKLKGNKLGDAYSFWYFPSSLKKGSNKITIWLNGGPGCSSFEGVTQENGPFTIAPGATNATVNPYAWTTVSDMLYVEQPAGTGFSLGSDADLYGEVPLANDFYEFLQSFFEVFTELKHKQLRISGESYAGFYIPYIAHRILTASHEEKKGLPKLHGILINDGVYSSDIVNEQAPSYRYAAREAQILGFNSSYLDHLKQVSESCGYEALLDAVTYPPAGPIPLTLPEPVAGSKCDVFDDMLNAAYAINPCFNIYRITDVCPTPVDIIGNGAYFTRPDVQAAIHDAASGNWSECSTNRPFINDTDRSPFTETLIPGILKEIPFLMWHGLVDAILFDVGDRVTIQNMTWNGHQGFSVPPTAPIIVDGKQVGVFRTERRLTYAEIDNAGHMIPEDQPKTALALFSAFLEHGNIGNGHFDTPQ